MHPVRIEHHQRPQIDLVSLELVLTQERIACGIHHRECHFALSGADKLQIVDRAAGNASGRLHTRKML